jgi:hypothetical protein
MFNVILRAVCDLLPMNSHGAMTVHAPDAIRRCVECV